MTLRPVAYPEQVDLEVVCTELPAWIRHVTGGQLRGRRTELAFVYPDKLFSGDRHA